MTTAAAPQRDRLAAEIRGARAAVRMTIDELAGATGITPSSLARKLRGETAFTVDDLASIGHALKLSPACLLERAGLTPEPAQRGPHGPSQRPEAPARPLSRWPRDDVAHWPSDLYGSHRTPYLIREAYDPHEHAAAWRIPVLRVDEMQPPHVGARGVTGWFPGRPPYIELRNGLSRAVERSTLAHELVHVERGTFPGWAVTWEERLVTAIAARRLLLAAGRPDWLDRPELTDDAADAIAARENVDRRMIRAAWRYFGAGAAG